MSIGDTVSRRAGGVRLSAEAVDAVMPFHLRLDSAGQVIAAGRSIRKLSAAWEHEPIGADFFDLVEMLRPISASSVDDLSARKGGRLIFSLRAAPDVRFRAMASPLADGGLFLYAAVDPRSGDLTDVLAREDFAPADVTPELIRLAAQQSRKLETARDLMDRLRNAQARAQRLAHQDLLTGLPNRLALIDFLTSLRDPDGRAAKSFTVLRFDVDRFRRINDAFGHEAGDRVLRNVARQLSEAAPADALATRLDGDDFALVLDGANPEAAQDVAATLRQRVAGCRALEGRGHTITASVGLAICPKGAPLDIERVLADVKIAADDAKRAERGGCRAFDPSMRRAFEAANQLRIDIEEGIATRAFTPHFQPQVDIRTGAVIGMEALARWRHPTRGVLGPAAFLAAAEEAELLDMIDQLIVDQALSAMGRWQAGQIPIGKVGLNVTTSRLADPGFVDSMKWAADQVGLAPEQVGLEVLETVLLDSERGGDALVTRIRELSEAGFVMELDDFGTGRASIANLRRFKVDLVKIDRTFISGLDEDPDLRTITGALIRLAHDLGISVLAEGVETSAEQAAVAALGCTRIQGWGIAKPMPEEEVADWVDDHLSRFTTDQRAAG